MPAADNKPSTSLKSRATLKSYFRSGNLPTQQNFYDLIESMVNRVDDDMDRPADSIEPTPPGPSGKNEVETAGAVGFYPLLPTAATAPAWLIRLQEEPATPDLAIEEVAQPTTPADLTATDAAPGQWPGISRLHLQAGGNVGIGTTTPAHQLEVSGFVASQGRIGTYTDAQCPGTEVPADGQWHPILRGLDGLHAFEIVAAAYGPAGRGRYAIAHATALSAYGTSHSSITQKQAWFGGWFKKIRFRWTGSLHDYGLEVRTASSFGEGARIVYHITHLFDDRRPPAPAADPLD